LDESQRGFCVSECSRSFNQETRRGSTGVVVRYDNGNLFATSNEPVNFAFDAATTEPLVPSDMVCNWQIKWGPVS
jgi:hypothetical protein